jgi:hypothetical protein
MLSTWLGRRYDRSALPDEFNHRWQGVHTQIAAGLKSRGGNISGIYLSLTSEELPAARPYEITIIGTMRRVDFERDELRVPAQHAFDQVAAAFDACAGIEVMYSELTSEAQVSLDEIGAMRSLGLEYISYRDPRHSIFRSGR